MRVTLNAMDAPLRPVSRRGRSRFRRGGRVVSARRAIKPMKRAGDIAIRPFGVRIRPAIFVAALAALVLTASVAPRSAQAGPEAGGESGVLLELFTSQGCYSCPPADKLLGQLAERDGVIGLSLNVDYWDYLGWKDPLARKAYTLRQYGYVNAMRKRAPFTPQLVVHGVKSVVGSDAPNVASAIKAARSDDSFALELKREDGTLKVALAKRGGGEGCMVLAAPYRKEVVQVIDTGENGGKTLTYHNVALDLRKLGAFSGGEAAFSMEVPDEADGVAVWVQRSTRHGPFGAVRTAAKLEF